MAVGAHSGMRGRESRDREAARQRALVGKGWGVGAGRTCRHRSAIAPTWSSGRGDAPVEDISLAGRSEAGLPHSSQNLPAKILHHLTKDPTRSCGRAGACSPQRGSGGEGGGAGEQPPGAQICQLWVKMLTFKSLKSGRGSPGLSDLCNLSALHRSDAYLPGHLEAVQHAQRRSQ